MSNDQIKSTSDPKYLARNVMIGAFAGIIVGILFGDYCAILDPIGVIYTRLLQVAVYPYLICTLISGLGLLPKFLAKQIFARGWIIYIGLIILTMVVIYFLTSALPITSSTSAQTSQQQTNLLLPLIVPDNIFFSLANDSVPAIVIFSTLFGIMAQRIPNAGNLFSFLEIISNLCLKFWQWLVELAPYAIFTLIASTVGTLGLSQLIDMIEFFSFFFLGIFILTFWLLPTIITSIIPITYKELFQGLKNALIVSLATTLSVMALPDIKNYAQSLVHNAKHKKRDKNIDPLIINHVINTNLAISYPFGQLGNIFIWLFIVFAATYFHHSISRDGLRLLPLMSYFSSVGSPSTSVASISFFGTINATRLPI